MLTTLEFGRCFWHFLISCVRSCNVPCLNFATYMLQCYVFPCKKCSSLQSRFSSEKVTHECCHNSPAHSLCLTHVLKLDVSYIDSESVEILHSCCLRHGFFTGDLQWGLVCTGSGEERLLASSCGILQ